MWLGPRPRSESRTGMRGDEGKGIRDKGNKESLRDLILNEISPLAALGRNDMWDTAEAARTRNIGA